MAESRETQPESFTGTIHIVPYSHADIAWIHTRAWHIDRYVRLMDEALEELERNPDYCYYIDTWVELARPYIEARPGSTDRIRKFMNEGRLAVCGGQYGNVRVTCVGNETSIRNIQYGIRRWREVKPDFSPSVYSNLDVTFGHSQMPQLLKLAGIGMYLAGRPLEALDEEGVPRAFHWKGLSGDTILMYRNPGIGLYQESDRHGESWDTDWDAAVKTVWDGSLVKQASQPVSNLCLCAGCDDTRPDRFWGDKWADYDELIRLWNERMPSKMVYSTLDRLYSALQLEEHAFQTIEGVLDPTDVHYNCAWNGRRGIWWLREKADRLLVDAEILSTLAVFAGNYEYPDSEIMEAWENLLDWTPHAVQAVFRQDWRSGCITLENTVDSAQKIIDRAVEGLFDKRLPMEGGGLAVVNPLPFRRKEIIRLWLINTDLRRDLDCLLDAEGRKLQFQVVSAPVGNAEMEILAEVEAPACGFTTLGFEWVDAGDVEYLKASKHYMDKYGAPDRRKIDDPELTVSSDRIKISFKNGQFTAVEDIETGFSRVCTEDSSFLQPVCCPINRGDDWLTTGIPDNPEGFEAGEIFIDETGPMRWRVTRTGRTGGFWVRQNIDLLKGERAVHSTLQFLDPGDEDDKFIAISIPVAEDASLETDIPFGIEPRDLGCIKYGAMERAIPGFFWGRTWVNTEDAAGEIALVSEDGDKFFRMHGGRLVHFLAQKTRVFEKSWEAFTDLFDVGGRQVFNHVLIIGNEQKNELARLADMIRHPLRTAYINSSRLGTEEELLKISPDSVSLSAFYREDGNVFLRVVQMASEPAEVEITLPFDVKAAAAVDLNGKAISAQTAWDGRVLRLNIKPWQILTLKILPICG